MCWSIFVVLYSCWSFKSRIYAPTCTYIYRDTYMFAFNACIVRTLYVLSKLHVVNTCTLGSMLLFVQGTPLSDKYYQLINPHFLHQIATTMMAYAPTEVRYAFIKEILTAVWCNTCYVDTVCESCMETCTRQRHACNSWHAHLYVYMYMRYLLEWQTSMSHINVTCKFATCTL